MPRTVPADLENALAAAPAAREYFWSLPPEQVDEWVAWVEGARMPRARRNRIAETVRRLGGGRPAAALATDDTIVATNGNVATNGARPVAGPPRESPWLWLLAIVGLLGIAALIYFLAVRNNDSGSKPAPAAVSAKSTVPKVVGLREPAARFQLEQKKLATTVVKLAAAQPRGIVVGQKPKQGATVPHGTAVTIVVSTGPATVTLVRVVGLPAPVATKRLQAQGFATTIKQVASAKAPGTVIAQKPAAGGLAKAGTVVVLDVAKSTVAVPDVSGQTAPAATAALKRAGLSVTAVQVPSSQPQGTVVAQSPAAGRKVASGSNVRLNVSKGTAQQQQTTTQAAPQTTTQSGSVSSLPAAPPQGSGNDYRGMRLAPAVQQLAQGRQQAVVQYVASTKPAGIVVSNGTVGSKMRLSVSAGPHPAPSIDLPDVTGEDAAQAQSDLQTAGFTVVTVQWPVSDQSSDGTVVFETPAGGGTAPRGVAIVLYVGSTTTG